MNSFREFVRTKSVLMKRTNQLPNIQLKSQYKMLFILDFTISNISV